MNGRNHLVVFLKAPRPGQVKTRLAQTLGAEAACRIYTRLVTHLIQNLASLTTVDLAYAPDDGAAAIHSWQRPNWGAFPQGPGDLGARLSSAFRRQFAAGAQRVVVIGSDCPEVTPEDITLAWNTLKRVDVVLGPATDGGYWLIGLRRLEPDLFVNMPWSEPLLLTETLRRIADRSLTVELLRELSDVDTLDDWQTLSDRMNHLLLP